VLDVLARLSTYLFVCLLPGLWLHLSPELSQQHFVKFYGTMTLAFAYSMGMVLPCLSDCAPHA
jgi:hypothetical protein